MTCSSPTTTTSTTVADNTLSVSQQCCLTNKMHAVKNNELYDSIWQKYRRSLGLVRQLLPSPQKRHQHLCRRLELSHWHTKTVWNWPWNSFSHISASHIPNILQFLCCIWTSVHCSYNICAGLYCFYTTLLSSDQPGETAPFIQLALRYFLIVILLIC